MTADSAPRVVIIGAGFGGLACAKALAGSAAHVTVIDRQNYHLFVPLLYQVATAALSPADIARPIRRILGRAKNIDVVYGEVVALDSAARVVTLADNSQFSYDHCVVSTGSEYSYFGHPEWAQFATGPRDLDHARRIRTQLLTAFERAERACDTTERESLMTTIIVGGGPTGVEMAGAVAELYRYALARDFHHIDPRTARIVLVEAGPRLLPAFPEPLADYAVRALQKLGVTAMVGKRVEKIDADGAVIDGKMHRAGCVVWGAGVQASSAGRWLNVALDRAGRVAIAPDLSVPGHPGLYVIGDMALLNGKDNQPLPALAQVAAQQGQHLGSALVKQFRTGKKLPAFRFRDRGNTAVIGRHAAVFDFGRFQLKGRFAWFLWLLIHVYLLVGFENRLLVVMQWAWHYVTFERGARLITPPERGSA